MANHSLTPYERRVLALLAAGLSGPQIARRLGVQAVTVRDQTAAIFGKLGVHNRTEAALLVWAGYIEGVKPDVEVVASVFADSVFGLDDAAGSGAAAEQHHPGAGSVGRRQPAAGLLHRAGSHPGTAAGRRDAAAVVHGRACIALGDADPDRKPLPHGYAHPDRMGYGHLDADLDAHGGAAHSHANANRHGRDDDDDL